MKYLVRSERVTKYISEVVVEAETLLEAREIVGGYADDRHYWRKVELPIEDQYWSPIVVPVPDATPIGTW